MSLISVVLFLPQSVFVRFEKKIQSFKSLLSGGKYVAGESEKRKKKVEFVVPSVSSRTDQGGSAAAEGGHHLFVAGCE